MCQPGRPAPSEVSHDCSPGLTAFQRAVFDAVEVFVGELTIFWEAGDAEVPRTVFGLVRNVFGGELFDEADHIGNAGRGVGDVLWTFDREGVEVFKEGALKLLGVLGDGKASGGGVADDLVVDVGDVHDVLDGYALLANDAAEHVDVEEGAEVADVAVVVDGGAATVHAKGGRADGGKGFDLAAKGVEEFDRCHLRYFPAAAGAVRGADCSRLKFLDDFS